MGVLLLVFLWGGLLAASIRFLYRRARRFFQWRKDTPVPRWKRLMILLPPVCLVLAAAIRLLPQLPGYCPARRDELRTLTAPVESVREYKSSQVSGRSVQTVKQYRVYVKGYSGAFYLPDNFRFDKEAFLRWAGAREITFYYARVGPNPVPYQIERLDGSVFLHYDTAYERLSLTFVTRALTWPAFLCFLLGGAFSLPGYLCVQNKPERRERIAIVGFVLVTLTLLFAIARVMGRSKITDTPAESFYSILPAGGGENTAKKYP